jgi:transposase
VDGASRASKCARSDRRQRISFDEEPSMMNITTIGLDLAKNVFQVHAIDAAGRVMAARRLRRAEVLRWFAKLTPCRVGIEACGSAHYWAREIGKLGHAVKLMPPNYVKAYVKRGKTDAADAAAICEAVTRPSMTFVPVKSAEQQSLAMLHSVRAKLISQRTQSINALRGHLAELGIIAAKGFIGLGRLAATVRDEQETRLPEMARHALLTLLAQIEAVSGEIARLDAAIRAEHETSETSQRLETVPGVGPVTASAVRARIGDGRRFEDGRHMAAWLGLTPAQDESGGQAAARDLQKGRPLPAPTPGQRSDGAHSSGTTATGEISGARQAAHAHEAEASRGRARQQDGARALGAARRRRHVAAGPPQCPLSHSSRDRWGRPDRLGNGNVRHRQGIGPHGPSRLQG